jgi:hypothetical protein
MELKSTSRTFIFTRKISVETLAFTSSDCILFWQVTIPCRTFLFTRKRSVETLASTSSDVILASDKTLAQIYQQKLYLFIFLQASSEHFFSQGKEASKP